MMNLAHLLIRSARSFSAQPAIFEGKRQVHDYAGLATRAAVLANHLADDCALLPGDRVALVMTNNPSYVEVLFGIWHAGLVAVPINAKLHSREVGYVLQHSGARICFVSGDLEGLATHLKTELPLERTVSVDSKEYQQMATVGRLAAIVPRAADDVAWLFYTSGTTGRPKGAMLTHRNLWAMTLAYFTDVDAVSPRDCIFHAAPMSHGSGLYALPHVLQAAAHVIPESGKFDPAEVTFAWIPNSLHLATLAVSENLRKNMESNPAIEILAEAQAFPFDDNGDLPAFETFVETASPLATAGLR